MAMVYKRKAMSTGKQPAFHPNHAAPLIQILAWLFLAFSTLSIIAHFATKLALSRRLTREDFILLSSLVSLFTKMHYGFLTSSLDSRCRTNCIDSKSGRSNDWKLADWPAKGNRHGGLEGKDVAYSAERY